MSDLTRAYLNMVDQFTDGTKKDWQKAERECYRLLRLSRKKARKAA